MSDSPALAHIVFFKLKDSSEQNIAKLVASCDKYLSDHPGCQYYSAGTLVPDLARPVNDRDFDVALHVVFRSMADHDAYQANPQHVQFITENKPTWKTVRVFDSEVE